MSPDEPELIAPRPVEAGPCRDTHEAARHQRM